MSIAFGFTEVNAVDQEINKTIEKDYNPTKEQKEQGTTGLEEFMKDLPTESNPSFEGTDSQTANPASDTSIPQAFNGIREELRKDLPTFHKYGSLSHKFTKAIGKNAENMYTEVCEKIRQFRAENPKEFESIITLSIAATFLGIVVPVSFLTLGVALGSQILMVSVAAAGIATACGTDIRFHRTIPKIRLNY